MSDRNDIIDAILAQNLIMHGADRRLKDRYGSSGAIVSKDIDGREVINLGCIQSLYTENEDIRSFVDEGAYRKAAAIADTLIAEGMQIITILDDCYPEQLLRSANAPAVLYVKSQTTADALFKDRTFVSIVGTRDPSPYGLEMTRKVVEDLQQTEGGVTIVSGLALGIDAKAHREALENGIPTIAVLPNGLDTVYPQAHRGLAEKIATTPGCALITTFPPQTAPLAINFLQRNATIAGLSDSLYVIESKKKGGAMVTARHAYFDDRKVYAIPGRADDVRSKGCNLLIKEGAAELYMGTEG